MSTRLRILVAVDDTDATERALAYAGAMLCDRDEARLVVLHVLGPLPEELGVPKGRAVTDEPRDMQAAWMAEARKDAKPLLDKARRILEKAGVDADAIEVKVAEAKSSHEVPEAILEAARSLGCGTVVLGREAVSWAPQLFRPHVGETVVKQGGDLAVWIVG